MIKAKILKHEKIIHFRKVLNLQNRRAVAGIIDFAVVSWVYFRYLVFAVVAYFFVVGLLSTNSKKAILEDFFSLPTILFLYSLGYFLYGYYHVVQEKSPHQATYGKRFTRLKVVQENNKRISTYLTIIRFLWYFLFFHFVPIVLLFVFEQFTMISWLFWCMIWFYGSVFHVDKRAYHDRLSYTKVVEAKTSEEVDWTFLQGSRMEQLFHKAARRMTEAVKKVAKNALKK